MEMVTARRFKLLHPALGPSRTSIRRPQALVGVRKETAEVAVAVEPDGERTLRFTLSTGAIDRDNDKIDPNGWRVFNYQKNPVVLWAHQALLLPIGKALDIAPDGERLSAAVRFLPADDYGEAGSFADTVYRLAKDGWLAGTSVGFLPIRWDFTADPERGADDWWPGIDYHEQELVEFSLVTVPSNPEALIEPEPLALPEPRVIPIAGEAGMRAIPAANLVATRRRRRRRALTAALARR